MKILFAFFALLLAVAPVSAETNQLGPDIYQVTEGVAFQLENLGASNYLFSWTDTNGSFTQIADPSLVLRVGETYTFQRVTSAHPFVITNDTLPVDGTDGSYFRTTTSGAVIDAATLTPIADFTADPAPTSDLITWSPGSTGNFFYTCRVTSHTGMTGAIRIETAPVSDDVSTFGAVKALYED